MNKKEYSAIVVVVCLFLMGVMIMGVAIKHALEPKPDHSVHAVSENDSQEDREEYVAPAPPELNAPDEYVAPAPPAKPIEPNAPDEYVAPAPPTEPIEPDERPQLLPEGGCTPDLSDL